MVMGRPSIVALVMVSALLEGCTKPPTSGMESHLYSGSYPIKVVVSTGMVGDIIREGGGQS